MSFKSPQVLSDSYQLTVMVFGRIRNFPKHYRPTLGRRLEERAIDLTTSIRVASLAKKTTPSGSARSQHLDHASHALDEIRILLQLAYDLQILAASAYAELSEMTGVIGRQIGGFAKEATTST